jgi:hypothetical protein
MIGQKARDGKVYVRPGRLVSQGDDAAAGLFVRDSPLDELAAKMKRLLNHHTSAAAGR